MGSLFMSIPPRHRSAGIACALLLLLLAGRLEAQNLTSNPTGQRAGTTGGNTQNRTGTGASAPNSSTASSTRTYRNNTQLGDALIQIDPETRSLIVVADEDTDKEISRTIRNLDQPKPQVLIKVLFAQVTLDNNLDFGVEGNYAFDINKPATSQLVTTGGATGRECGGGGNHPHAHQRPGGGRLQFWVGCGREPEQRRVFHPQHAECHRHALRPGAER